MVDSATLTELLDALSQSIDGASRTTSLLPPSSDLSFERTLSRPLAKQLDSTSLSLLSLADSLLTWSSDGEGGSWKGLDGEMLREGEYRDVIGALEGLLEGADDGIERAQGVGKYKNAAVITKPPQKEMKNQEDKTKPLPTELRLADIPKPQLLFNLNLDRSPISLFDPPKIPSEPLWTPHFISPLPTIIELPLAVAPNLTHVPIPPTSSYAPLLNLTYPSYSHPYAKELDTYEPPASFFVKPVLGERKGDGKWDEVDFEWIGTKEGLEKLVEEIKEQERKDLAIDLEHHDTRSWGGITSLMQLSTRTKDYVIDVLNPDVRANVHTLNQFFTDPTWIKVFHGAFSDIIWLQRDLGLYIVGLFDTYCATKVLEYQQHSLASLLMMYTDFLPDKRYQLADWRIRPIPTEMLRYARADTHFLLDIYDNLRLALHALPSPPTSPSPLQSVISQSLLVSSSTYTLSPYTHLSPSGPLSLLSKFSSFSSHFAPLPTLSNGWAKGEIKFERLIGLCNWRENEARREDESTHFIFGDRGIEFLCQLGSDVEDDFELMRVLGSGLKGGLSTYLRGMESVKKDRRGRLLEALKEARGRVVVKKVDDESGKMDVDADEVGVNVGEERVVQALEGLWGETASGSDGLEDGLEKAEPPVASTSTFFGVVKKEMQKGLKVGSSTLFGSKSEKGKGKGVESIRSGNHGGKAKEAKKARVAEIHKSLVLGGGLGGSQPIQAAPTPIVIDPVIEPFDPTPSTNTDIPISNDHSFVPFSDRAPKSTTSSNATTKKEKSKLKEETIIVSSLPGTGSGGKKRRRGKTDLASGPSDSTTTLELNPSTNSTETDTEVSATPKAKKPKKIKPSPSSIIPHDYSSQPSILDSAPTTFNHAGTSKKDKKAQKLAAGGVGGKKGFEIDTSEFRREPRVNNASKKGLVSRSFAGGSGSVGK